MPAIIIDLAQENSLCANLLSLRRARVGGYDLLFIDSDKKLYSFYLAGTFNAITPAYFGAVSEIAPRMPNHFAQLRDFNVLTDNYDDVAIQFASIVRGDFVPHTGVRSSLYPISCNFTTVRISWPFLATYKDVPYETLRAVVEERYNKEELLAKYFFSFFPFNQNIVAKKLPDLGPYATMTFLSLKKGPRYTSYAIINSNISILRNLISSEEMVRLLVTNMDDDDFSSDGPSYPYSLLVKVSTFPNVRTNNSGPYHPRLKRFKKPSTNPRENIDIAFYRFGFITVILAITEQDHKDLGPALSLHLTNEYSGDFCFLEERPLGTPLEIGEVAPAPPEILENATASAVDLFGGSIGLLSLQRFQSTSGHKSQPIFDSKSFRQLNSEVCEVTPKLSNEAEALQSIRHSNQAIRQLVQSIQTLQSQLEGYEAQKTDFHARAQQDQQALDALSIDFSSVNNSLQEVATLAAEKNVDLSLSFKNVLEALKMFDAYLSAIFFPSGVSARYNVEKNTYALYNGVDFVRQLTAAEFFAKTSGSVPFTGAEIVFTKPFLNTCIAPNGTIDKKHSYLLYPFVFRYNEDGPSVLASRKNHAMTKNAYAKIHPHLRSITMLPPRDQNTHYGFGWNNSSTPDLKVVEQGASPCVGSLSSHISTAFQNKDLPFLIRGMLSWATSNSGPHDTWSRECQGFAHISLENILNFSAVPYESLKLNGVYFDKKRVKTYALFSDPIASLRSKLLQQIPEQQDAIEIAQYYLYEVPCKFDPEKLTVSFDICDAGPKTLLSKTSTNRLRRLSSAVLLPPSNFTNLESFVEVAIPSVEQSAPERESSNVP
jgi:hypothetical protein